METINVDDIEIIDLIISIDDTNLIMAKLKNNLELINKLGLTKKYKDYFLEIYFNYFIKTKISELEIMIYDSEKKENIINDIFINLSKDELNICLNKVQKYLKEKKEKTYV